MNNELGHGWEVVGPAPGALRNELGPGWEPVGLANQPVNPVRRYQPAVIPDERKPLPPPPVETRQRERLEPAPQPAPQVQQPQQQPLVSRPQPVQQQQAAPQAPQEPLSKGFFVNGKTYTFPSTVSDESAIRWLNKNVTAKTRGKTPLPREKSGGRSLFIDPEEHAKQRMQTELGKQGRVEYAQALSGKDDQGNEIVVTPEQITPQALAQVINDRKKYAAEMKGKSDPVSLRDFEDDTAMYERDLGRLWDNETTAEYKQRTGRKDASPTPSASARDAAILAIRQQPVSQLEQQEVTKPGQQPTDTGLPGQRLWGDVPVTAAKAAVGLPQAATGVIDWAATAANPLASLARLGKQIKHAVSGEEDTGFQGWLGWLQQKAGIRYDEAQQILENAYSPEQQKANQAVSNAKGILPKIGAALQNPSVIANTVVESIPQMLAGGMIGKAVGAVPQIGKYGYAIGEGVISAGSGMEQARAQSPTGLLTDQQVAVLESSGALTGAIGVLGGKVASRLGIEDIDKLVAGNVSDTAKRNVMVKALAGALVEGGIEEAPQSIQEKIASNLANNKPWYEGWDEAAVMGALSGGVMGAGAQVMPSRVARLQQLKAVQAKGFVSEQDAKDLGLPPKASTNRKTRIAAVKGEINQLEKEIKDAESVASGVPTQPSGGQGSEAVGGVHGETGVPPAVGPADTGTIPPPGANVPPPVVTPAPPTVPPTTTESPAGKPTGPAGEGGVVIRDRGLEAANDIPKSWTVPDNLYRGMTEDEFQATVGGGTGVASRGDWSIPGEGTSFSDLAEDAESYVNFGRTDPRKTGRPTYVVEVLGREGTKKDRDGYWKAESPIPIDRVGRVWRIDADGNSLVANQIAKPEAPATLPATVPPATSLTPTPASEEAGGAETGPETADPRFFTTLPDGSLKQSEDLRAAISRYQTGGTTRPALANKTLADYRLITGEGIPLAERQAAAERFMEAWKFKTKGVKDAKQEQEAAPDDAGGSPRVEAEVQEGAVGRGSKGVREGGREGGPLPGQEQAARTEGEAKVPVEPPVVKPGDLPGRGKKPKSVWNAVGKNSAGQAVLEDQNGVRAYVENGTRVTEPVAMVPTKGGMRPSVNISTRGDEYKTVEEMQDQKVATPAAKQPYQMSVDEFESEMADRELATLHTSRARTEGLVSVSDAEVRKYFDSLRDAGKRLAGKDSPQVESLVDSAERSWHRGDFGKAIEDSEMALSLTHSNLKGQGSLNRELAWNLHRESVQKAIDEGLIESHPDWPELTRKAAPSPKIKGPKSQPGNLYAGGKEILQAGMAAGELMNRAKAAHDASADDAVKSEALAIWNGLNDGTIEADEAVRRIEAIEAAPPSPKPDEATVAKQPWEITKAKWINRLAEFESLDREIIAAERKVVEIDKRKPAPNADANVHARWYSDHKVAQDELTRLQMIRRDEERAFKENQPRLERMQRESILKAQERGDAVPAEVLADYPDLKSKPAEAPANQGDRVEVPLRKVGPKDLKKVGAEYVPGSSDKVPGGTYTVPSGKPRKGLVAGGDSVVSAEPDVGKRLLTQDPEDQMLHEALVLSQEGDFDGKPVWTVLWTEGPSKGETRTTYSHSFWQEAPAAAETGAAAPNKSLGRKPTVVSPRGQTALPGLEEEAAGAETRLKPKEPQTREEIEAAIESLQADRDAWDEGTRTDLTDLDIKEIDARINELNVRLDEIGEEEDVAEDAAATPAEAPAAKAETPAVGTWEGQRTTPRVGTPERTAFDAEVEAAEKAADDARHAEEKIKSEMEKTGRYTKKHEALEKRREKAREKSNAAYAKWDKLRDQWRRSRLEDAAEQIENPIMSIAARLELKPDITAEERRTSAQQARAQIEELIRPMLDESIAAETDGAGRLSAEDDKGAIDHIVSMTAHDIVQNPLMAENMVDRVRGRLRAERLEVYRSMKFKELDATGVAGLEDLGTRMRNVYDFDSIDKIVETAKQRQKMEQEAERKEREVLEERVGKARDALLSRLQQVGRKGLTEKQVRETMLAALADVRSTSANDAVMEAWKRMRKEDPAPLVLIGEGDKRKAVALEFSEQRKGRKQTAKAKITFGTRRMLNNQSALEVISDGEFAGWITRLRAGGFEFNGKFYKTEAAAKKAAVDELSGTAKAKAENVPPTRADRLATSIANFEAAYAAASERDRPTLEHWKGEIQTARETPGGGAADRVIEVWENRKPAPQAKAEEGEGPEPKRRGGPGASIPVSPTPVGKTPSTGEVVKKISDNFNVPVRTGHFAGPHAGIYKELEEVARTKGYGDIAVASHEVAHHLDRTGGVLTNWRAVPAAARAELKALDYQSNRGDIHEGFAEYVRHRLTMDDAATVAPQFDAWFNSWLSGNQAATDAFTKSKAVVDQWRQAGSLARVEAQIDMGESLWQKVGKGLRHPVGVIRNVKDWIVDNWYNRLGPLLRVSKEMVGAKTSQQVMQKMAGDVNFWAFAKVSNMGAASRVREWAEIGTADVAGNRTGAGLRETLAPIADELRDKDTLRQFYAYCYARHAVDIYANYNQEVADWNAAGQNGPKPRLKEPGILESDAKNVVNQFDTRPGWKSASDGITDWHNALIDYLVDAGGLSPELRDTLKTMYPHFISLARKMDSEFTQAPGGGGSRFANLPSGVMRLKGSGREIQPPLESALAYAERIIGIADKVRVGRMLVEASEKYGTLGDTVEKVDPKTVAHTARLESLKNQLEKAGADLSVADMDSLLTIFSQDIAADPKDNILVLWRNGERQLYYVRDDLYKAMTAFGKPFRLPAIVDQTAGRVARMIRLGTTGLKPGFSLITNILRDVQTAMMQTEYQSRNPFSIIGNTVSAFIKDIAGSEVAQLWQRGGGPMAQPLSMDRRFLKEAIGELTAQSPKDKAMNWMSHPVDSLRSLFSLPEAAPRLAEFEAALRKEGWTPGKKVTFEQYVKAQLAAANVTVDFREGGTLAMWINQLVPFFNANIQGPARMASSIVNHPVATAITGLLWITLPALGLWWKQKDEEWYKKLTPQERGRYWHIKIPRTETILRIPKPFEWGFMFGSIPEGAMETAFGENKDAFKEQVGEALDGLVPDIIPGIAQAPTEIAANRDFWRDAPLVSERLENVLPEDQVTPQTSETAKAIGRLFGVSPIYVEHLAEGWTGGLATDAVKAVESGVGVATHKTTRQIIGGPSALPVVGRLFLSPIHSRTLDDFYTKLQEMEQNYGSARLGKKTSTPPSKLSRFRQAADLLSELRKKSRLILDNANLTDDQKRTQFMLLHKRMSDVANKAMQKK